MNFFVETYGCQMNRADSTFIIKSLVEKGFYEVYDPLEADFVIVNACSVRKTAESRIWGRLGFYKKLKEKKKIFVIVTGCMAQRLGSGFFKESPAVDIVVGTFNKDKIAEVVANYQRGQKIALVDENNIHFGASSPDAENPKRAYVTISHGCNNFCSYCIVPYLRGREVSRDSGEIIEDINNLVKLGVKQATLLGQNVNSYGNDTNDINFPSLLKKISNETDIKWIKYLSSHPKDFTDELIEVISTEKKVSKWLHLAVQSGSNKILEKMNRKYKIETYIEKVMKLKSLNPGLNLTTDIIVGFPGETESDYKDTVELINKVKFDDAFMYKYNIRENTFAAKELGDDVPEDEKLSRLSKIIDLQREIKSESKKKRIGSTLEVIPEKFSKNSDREILGNSAEDLMVLFQGEDKDFEKIVKVKVTKLKGGSLFGEVVD